MPGLDVNSVSVFHPRTVLSKSVAYSVLTTDEEVILTGSTARTFTLPGMDAVAASLVENKAYKFTNNATAILTISPGTNGVTGVAQTIAGRSSYDVKPGEYIIVYSGTNKTDWSIRYPNPIPAERRNIVTLVALTTGTTPVNLVDATGAPVNGTIESVFVASQDTTAGNIIVKNGANTVVTIAKGTAAGVMVTDAGLANTAVTAGNVLTAESSSAGNARVHVIISNQTYV